MVDAEEKLLEDTIYEQLDDICVAYVNQKTQKEIQDHVRAKFATALTKSEDDSHQAVVTMVKEVLKQVATQN